MPTATVRNIPFRLASKFGQMVLAFEGDSVRISDEAAEFYPEFAGQTFTVIKAPFNGTSITVEDAEGNLLKGHGRIFDRA